MVLNTFFVLRLRFGIERNNPESSKEEKKRLSSVNSFLFDVSEGERRKDADFFLSFSFFGEGEKEAALAI